jgi:hypothetical protein
MMVKVNRRRAGASSGMGYGEAGIAQRMHRAKSKKERSPIRNPSFHAGELSQSEEAFLIKIVEARGSRNRLSQRA